jgi:ABC-type dipeptide/oligopeptide/nickel transport system permease subunit
MYWWNLQALKSELTQGPLAEPQAFKYLLAQALVVALAAGAVTRPWWICPATAAIAGFGTAYCYHANGGASGRDFLSRYVSLGWVIGIRVAAAFMPVGVLVGVSLGVLGAVMGGPEDVFRRGVVDPIKWSLGLVVLVAIYWRMGVHCADLRRRSAAPVGSAEPQQQNA